jgi:hypothetical protein
MYILVYKAWIDGGLAYLLKNSHVYVRQKYTFILMLNKSPCLEDVWENGGIAPLFLISALDRGEFSVITRPLSPEKGSPVSIVQANIHLRTFR